MYVSWQEDYLNEEGLKIFLPSTCSEPLACLVYLNWISNAENINNIKKLSSTDPFTYERYLITDRKMQLNNDVYDEAEYELSKQIAMEVNPVHHENLCVRYGPDVFRYYDTEIDYAVVYPDSTSIFLENVICAGEGEFDSVYEKQYETYITSGIKFLCLLRDNEWEKVMVQGNREPR